MSETIQNFKNIPNQEFNTSVGGFEYMFRFFLCDTFMAYDLSVIQSNQETGESEEVKIVEGFRVVFGQLLIPYPRQERNGNFILDILQGEEADYTQFGITQFLRYLTQDETDTWREGIKNGGA